MHDFVTAYGTKNTWNTSNGSLADAIEPAMQDEELSRLQADGFFADEKGFHDLERLRKPNDEAFATFSTE